MELLDSINRQMGSTRLPLVGITVAAVGCPDTPVIVTLHWHGFLSEGRSSSDELGTLTPVPSTSLQMNERWGELAELELAALEAGWALGAWDVVRSQRPACLRPGAGAQEAIDCLNAFGQCTVPYQGNDLTISDAPDADELIKLASGAGYFCWQFRPVFGGLWSDLGGDLTLNPDGTRDPQCPLRPLPATGEARYRTVYRFGAAPAA